MQPGEAATRNRFAAALPRRLTLADANDARRWGLPASVAVLLFGFALAFGTVVAIEESENANQRWAARQPAKSAPAAAQSGSAPAMREQKNASWLYAMSSDALISLFQRQIDNARSVDPLGSGGDDRSVDTLDKTGASRGMPERLSPSEVKRPPPRTQARPPEPRAIRAAKEAPRREPAARPSGRLSPPSHPSSLTQRARTAAAAAPALPLAPAREKAASPPSEPTRVAPTGCNVGGSPPCWEPLPTGDTKAELRPRAKDDVWIGRVQTGPGTRPGTRFARMESLPSNAETVVSRHRIRATGTGESANAANAANRATPLRAAQTAKPAGKARSVERAASIKQRPSTYRVHTHSFFRPFNLPRHGSRKQLTKAQAEIYRGN